MTRRNKIVVLVNSLWLQVKIKMQFVAVVVVVVVGEALPKFTSAVPQSEWQ